MDEENCFDTFFEGTSVRRSEEVRRLPGKTLVVDAQDSYGTTLEMHQLHKSRHVTALRVRKSASEKVLVECVPGVFVNTPRRLDMVDFLEISSHFYYDADLVAFDIPHSMTQVADSRIMSLADKRCLVKAHRGEVAPEEAVQRLSPGFRNVVGKAYAEDAVFSVSVLRRYLLGFGGAPFVYPKYGHREVSEALSRLNALKNIGHYVSSNLRVECADAGAYKFLIRSEYGDIRAKEYRRERVETPYHVRVLLVGKALLARTFVAVFDLPKTMWGIGLDDSAEACPEGRHLLYFWRRGGEVEDSELRGIGVDVDGAEMDIAFRGTHDNLKILSELVLSSDEVSLMDVCHAYPEFAHSLVGNACLYMHLLRKRFAFLPRSLLLQVFPSTPHANKLVSVSGTVSKQGPVLLSNVKMSFTCLRCGRSCFDKSSCESCSSAEIMEQPIFAGATTTQTIRIQDIGRVRSMAETMEVVLGGLHAGKFCPGDRVVVTGIVRIRLNQPRALETMRPSMYIDAVHVALEAKERRAEMDTGLGERQAGASACAFQGLRIRQQAGEKMHVLLVGDTGTGKSQLMSICARHAYPSVWVNGVCTTDAGLTSCAVRQGCDWTLEAGALVLADMGVCCIDEIESLRTSDRSGLLEAMEQQTLSIAKAGLVSTLNVRCSVIGSCSSKFRYGSIDELVQNSSLGTPLISRFDMVFAMFDTRARDAAIAEAVLSRSVEARPKELAGGWNLDAMTQYLQAVRGGRVEMSGSMQSVLVKYYKHKKRTAGAASECLTMRTLEGLARMAEAHAKLLMKTSVDEEDVVTAIVVAESCLGTAKRVLEYSDDIFLDEGLFKDARRTVLAALGV
ncbi:UNVERIFIED_CONTAM: hypothetical protein PYX00_011714 [Menopon gallinae]|uniref:MCM C-terminal AAA(+) ATPase domain-containing protein n=1 Tax=Menopon gallinae TaxID=328185 RepID=A0AAW2H870_9NEOP